MRVLSLFDGISCGRVALDRLGVKVDCYDAYEIDKNAITVAMNNWKDIKECGDVFQAKYKKNSYDLLIGGSPCTKWSIARGGRNREVISSGLGWDLFSQYVRALREVHPKWFLYENNASMADEIKEAITKELNVEPLMLDSADFSAQMRKRLYWTNIPLKNLPPKSTLVFKDIMCTDTSQYKYRSYENYKDTEKVSKDGSVFSWDTSGQGWYSQANRARIPDVKMHTVVNAIGGNDKNNIYVGNHTLRKILPVEAERLQTLPDNYTKIISSESKRVGLCGNGWTVDVIVYLLSGLKEVTS